MLIRLIGPVRIEHDGTVDTVGAPKRACVLAALAASPGTPVSQAELIDRVWGDDPPDAVLNVLYSYIARLRRALRATPARIERSGFQRYVLDVPAADVDVHAVRALAADAAATTGPAALDTWRRACALADGTALAGLGGDWAEEFRTAFARERLDVLGGRYGAELAAGNHDAVLAELAALCRDAPLHEPLAARLMLAYHRCGRPADALARYEEIRVRLRERLGADPSAELRRLHLRILDQDPALDLPAAVKRPAMLPSDIGGFVGREHELAALDALAGPGRPSALAAIAGPGGSGKTALAVHWGHRRRDVLTGGELYVNLRGFDRGEAVPPADALRRLLTALGVAADAVPADVDAAAELYRGLTADRRMLVVLDNARDADQVRPLLPGRGCVTLVTSRNSLAGLVAVNDALPVPVPLLAERESERLLAHVLGERRLAGQEEDAARLARLCGHLPLALRIAAASIAVTRDATIAAYVKTLEGAAPLDALTVDGDAEAAVAANLDRSYRVLPAEVRRFFCRIGLLPGEDVSRELADAVVAAPAGIEPGAALHQLEAGHLLDRYRPGRYRIHDLVRVYARTRAVRDLPPAERDALVEDFIAWHHRMAYTSGVDEEANVVIAAGELRGHPRLWRLAMHLHKIVNTFRSVDRAGPLVESALESARGAGDAEGMFRMTLLLSQQADRDGRIERGVALAREAVALTERLGAEARNAAKNNLAARLSHGDFAEAAELLAETIDSALAGEAPSPVFPLANLVTLCLGLREPERAGDYVRRFEAAFGPGWSDRKRALFALSKARVLAAEGRTADALGLFDEAIPVLRGHGQTFAECMAWMYRAGVLARAGRVDEAMTSIAASVRITEEDGFETFVEPLLEESLLHARHGDAGHAARLLEQAERRQPRPAPGDVALTHLVRGTIRLRRGRHEEAIEALGRAADMFGRCRNIDRAETALQALAAAREGAF